MKILAGLSAIALCALAACQPVQFQEGISLPATPKSQPAQLDTIAQEYIQMTLAMGELEAGYVDAYFGPEEKAQRAKVAPMSLAEAGSMISKLRARLQLVDPNTLPADAKGRKAFLEGQLTAAATRYRMLSGQKLSFAQESFGLFAATPVIKPLSHYDTALSRIDGLVPGQGDLASRVDAFQDRYVIPTDRLKLVFDAAILECKRRTEKHIALPKGEAFTMEFVTGKSWSGYNWYKGNYTSLIQINTDLPIRISRAVDLGCHEGYPGHHVYNMLLEQRLARGKGWQEYTIYPLYSPQSLIAEGSANYGIDLAFPGAERLAYERDVLYPLAGLDPSTAASYAKLEEAVSGLRGARFTIAQLYLDGIMTRTDAVAATQKYLLVSKARAEQSVSFTDTYHSYVINYGLGQDMVRAFIERGKKSEKAKWKRMERILSEPTLPSDLTR